MSSALDIADLIRTRLITPPVTDELETEVDLFEIAGQILVDRQKDITSDVTKAVSKARGTAVVILWQGYQPVSDHTKKPRMEHTYNISVHSKPVIAGSNWTADDVMQSIIARLWHWRPLGGHHFGEVSVKSGGLVPDKRYLIYDLEISIPATVDTAYVTPEGALQYEQRFITFNNSEITFNPEAP